MDLPKSLFIIFLIAWVILAINPLFRFEWFLENIAVFIFAPLAVWSYFKFRLSNLSYILIFIFGMMHIAAAHYTYGATPWGNWLSELLDLQRNHFDRIVHFLYGVFMMPVAMDLLKKYISQAWLLGLMAFAIIVSLGAFYEIVEFVVGVTVQPEKGLAFLGFQGDIWDTQKDMALQAIGALMGLFLFRLFKNKF